MSTNSNWNRKALAVGVRLGLVFAARKLMRPGRRHDLRGRAVLITGSSRGLGLVLAREFVREGCRVSICARDERELKEAQQDLEQYGPKVLAQSCDITQRGVQISALRAGRSWTAVPVRVS